MLQHDVFDGSGDASYVQWPTNLAEDMAKTTEPEIVLTGLWGWLTRRLGIQPWGQVLIIALGALLGVAIPLMISVETRLGNIDSALKDLPSKDWTSSQLQTIRGDLFKEFFSEAKKYTMADDFRDAAASLTAATILLRAGQVPPSDARFFETSISDLDFIVKHAPSTSFLSPLAKSSFDARTALATYRSSLARATIPANHQTVQRPLSTKELIQLFGMTGVMSWAGPPNVDMIQATGPGLNSVVHGGILADGWLTLDYLTWKGTTFVNMHIRYHGGPLLLDHVLFINCKFELAPDAHGIEVADYLALNRDFLLIG